MRTRSSLEQLEVRVMLSGTPTMVVDINTSLPNAHGIASHGIGRGNRPSPIVDLGGVAYFTGDSGQGASLWKSDGSARGTARVSTVQPGTSYGHPNYTAFKGQLFFAGSLEGTDTELWTSNGTESGTFRVKDIWPGAAGSSLRSLVATTNLLFFSANDSLRDVLWKSDGTENGTTPVINGDGMVISYPEDLVVLGDVIVFSTYDGNSTWEAWRSDGTATGTFPLGLRSTHPLSIIHSHGAAYMVADGIVWQSDGTKTGTSKWLEGLASTPPVGVADSLYFTGVDGGLWRTDGSAPIRVKRDLNAHYGIDLNGKLLFVDPNDGALWLSDGSEAGTQPLGNITVNAIQSGPWFSSGRLGNDLYFSAADANSGNDVALWKTDGTPHGTRIVSDIRTDGSSLPASFANIGGTLFFTAIDNTHGRELWVIRPDPIPGDLDNDRDVDSQDLTLFLANWTGTLGFGTGGKDKSTGDLDGDGDVDSNDILEFLSAWTGSQDADLQQQITPLPRTVKSETNLIPAAQMDRNDSDAYAQRIDEVFEQLIQPLFG